MTESNPTRDTYHHGNLKEALVAAALALIEESGVEQLSVRAAAKRAGVSPAAPFRHFPTKTALLTAVAEQATLRLQVNVQQALREAEHGDALTRFHAIGTAYLDWASANPTHFQIVSNRALIDYDQSDMRHGNEAIRALMASLLEEALQTGQLAPGATPGQVRLAARALAYGLARMLVDGHFPEWSGPDQTPIQAMHDALALFMQLIGPRR